MNFLIDNALSPRVAERLRAAAHDAVHVLDYRMHAAPGQAIFDRAVLESRIVVSVDTDFGALLLLREATAPSVILFRGASLKRSDEQATLILSSLAAIEAALRRRGDRRPRVHGAPPVRLVCPGPDRIKFQDERGASVGRSG